MSSFDSTSISSIDANSISWHDPARRHPARALKPAFDNLADATKHLEQLIATTRVGDPLIVNGTAMTCQPLPGNPQTILKAGFGAGRYNTLVTATSIQDGTFVISKP